ncbi:PREDICTED: uncharacterized protein LOC108976188, partial [Bactrocera latifrons]|uniref:uncharacterized protein LOC108976188 n=1 Tax=Bactrocera latifrons TaxID=174628 RepID=UPI0008DCF35C
LAEKQKLQQQQQQSQLLQISATTTTPTTPQLVEKMAHKRTHSQTRFKIRKTESVQETPLGATPTNKRAASKKRFSMRKSRSLDAEAYTLACVQSPLWATLTNARTINEILQDDY